MSRFTVGLTGGIGSGKSTVAACFANHGIGVVEADCASRAVVEPGQPALERIARRFGSSVLQADGRLDRAAMRARVFADPAERQWLESLLRPLISGWLREQLAASASPYTLLVNAVLVETGQERHCDRVLVVDAPEAAQLARTMARDGNSEEQVRAIMAVQADRTRRLAVADDVICNDGDLPGLEAEVAKLHERYLELALS